MSPLFILVVVIYWIFISGVVFLAGSFMTKGLVTAPSGADLCRLSDKNRCFGELSFFYIFLISLVTLIANIIHLYFHTSLVTDTPLKETMSIFKTFLFKTRYGRLGLFRTLLLILLPIITFICIKTPKKWIFIIGAFISLTLLVSISMTSHQALLGYKNIAFFIDIIHLISISLWIGGIFFIRYCYSFFLKDAAFNYKNIFKEMIKRFSNFATLMVVFAALSGAVLFLIRVKGLDFLFKSSYGIVLSLKVLTASFIFILGGINRFFVLPELNSPEQSLFLGAQKRLFFFVSAEAILGAIVLLLTSILTHLSPEG